jgi:hypothetical protein
MDRAKKSKVHTLTMPRSTMERSGMAGSNTYARRGQGKGLVLDLPYGKRADSRWGLSTFQCMSISVKASIGGLDHPHPTFSPMQRSTSSWADAASRMFELRARVRTSQGSPICGHSRLQIHAYRLQFHAYKQGLVAPAQILTPWADRHHARRRCMAT